MPRRRDERPRVLGPYWIEARQEWRIVVVNPEASNPAARRVVRHYREESEAIEDVEAARRLIEQNTALTMEAVIDAYEQHMQESETKCFGEIIRRMRVFFPADLHLGRLTPERGKKLYEGFRQRKKLVRTKGGKMTESPERISVSYHRAALSNAKTMLNWCIERGWMQLNPLAEVKGVGRKKAGKRKPTGDELQRLYAYCWPRVEAGDEAALGVMLALSMALRSGDLYRRRVRDVDMNGTQLVIESGKTSKSNEPRMIPITLQSYVKRLAEHRPPDEPLFKSEASKDGHHGTSWLYQAMERFCESADVPFFCPHALKGASGTVLAKRGAAANLIMDHLSHEETATTFRHYVDRGIVDGAEAAQAFKVIAGGKR